MRALHHTWLAVVAALMAAPSLHAAPALGLPIACTPGEDCWPVVYFDRDASPDAADYRCGRLSYDGHTGTDFAILDLARMAAGVPVIAAAPGVVRNIRDGMADVAVTEIDRASLDGRDCGNGVAIDHGDGWETLYCHLRQNSVVVEPGEAVTEGQQLGLVGLSGNTSFPHVELTVRHGETRIDPFTGSGEPADAASCGPGPGALWHDAALATMPYEPVVLTRIGFATGRLDWAAVQRGEDTLTTIPADAPALVVYFEAYALAAGDRLTVTLRDPEGKLFHEQVLDEDRAQARFFRFTGRRPPEGGFAPGIYRAEVRWEDAAGILLTTGTAEVLVE